MRFEKKPDFTSVTRSILLGRAREGPVAPTDVGVQPFCRGPFSWSKSGPDTRSSKPYQAAIVADSVMKHEIKRTYRYRLYPNKAQKQKLARTFGCSR
ncbi:helix-turn-helix domain-containing protein [Salinibacter ruber]|uniref:helix-turn-helix domain-containing protein n=1 Tax=Salinibacter ruber TaxID=146919 RepID=UPI00311AAB30